MSRSIWTLIAAVTVGVALRAQPASLEAIATIPLPNVSGRIDHLAYDAVRQRLFGRGPGEQHR